jgi:alanine racemase
MLALHKTNEPHRVFLKMNSGMNRLGFAPQRFRSVWTRLNALPQVDEISLMTHFSDADGPRGIAEQMARFEEATRDLPGERSVSNSAATLRHAQNIAVKADWIRPGIAVYGSSPDFPEHSAAHWGLQPAMSLHARIIAVQQLQAGDSVGYGSSFVAELPMRIGVVACGYADGYPRHCSTGTPVLVDGQRTRLLGRVSMDMLAVDLSALPSADLGSEVTLWGAASSGEVLCIDEVAACAQTLGYELMCALAHVEKDHRAVTVDESGEMRLWNIFVAERASDPVLVPTLQIFSMLNPEYPMKYIKLLAVPYIGSLSQSYYSDVVGCSTRILRAQQH